jgi:hypothetical protein
LIEWASKFLTGKILISVCDERTQIQNFLLIFFVSVCFGFNRNPLEAGNFMEGFSAGMKCRYGAPYFYGQVVNAPHARAYLHVENAVMTTIEFSCLEAASAISGIRCRPINFSATEEIRLSRCLKTVFLRCGQMTTGAMNQ